ncbi:TetR/AcrR family transcriptional regulator [Sphingomonas profundi]|uniref:TetR/AcrR family transcriptional regulator n=1 Tax=Alterirhizorhabdus profundi TaxID=2681549 RepID=UPI0012E7C1B4|nr:TetR/AcrR family transcriptional regulator [Sphingomonas profundi]
MPLIVDHDERRSLIAGVVRRMVAAGGLEAVTVRAVAREAGFSSTIVSHYFRDKRDLMAFTYGTIRSRAIAMIEAAFADGADLQSCFETLLPINPANLADWQAWFGFWGKATADAGLAAERIAGTEGTRGLFLRILERAQAGGELPDHLDLAFHADRLQMFVNGLASFVVMQPAAWPPAKQRAMLATELDVMKRAWPRMAEAPARRRRAEG